MPRRVVLMLTTAFVLAVACFLGSTWYVSRVSRDIDASASAIAIDAMPSIEVLAETRGDLRRLDVAATRFERSRGDAQRAELVGARTAVDDAFERYLSLSSSFSDERTLWAPMHRGLVTADRAVSKVLADPADGSAEEVTRAVNAAAESLRQGIELNAAHGRELAVEIEDGRRGTLRLSWALTVLSTLATALAAYLVVRAVVQHQQVVMERNRLLERRAGELEQFAARVAHDIVGPLSATRLVLEAAVRQAPEAGRQSLSRGQRGVDRVVAIVDGLLRFARAGAMPDPGAVAEVGAIVRGIVDDLAPVARARDIAVSLSPPPEGAVHAHPGVVASLVENLLGNALKYMGDRRVRRVDVRVTADERTVRIEVADTGPGIPAGLLDHIWEPHVRGGDRTQPGLGLGLATVAKIIGAHGGRRGVTSRVGEGSTFWCELPRAGADVDDRRALR